MSVDITCYRAHIGSFTCGKSCNNASMYKEANKSCGCKIYILDKIKACYDILRLLAENGYEEESNLHDIIQCNLMQCGDIEENPGPITNPLESVCLYKSCADPCYQKSQCISFLLASLSTQLSSLDIDRIHTIQATGFNDVLVSLSKLKCFYINYFDTAYHLKALKEKELKFDDSLDRYTLVQSKNVAYAIVKMEGKFHVFSSYKELHSKCKFDTLLSQTELIMKISKENETNKIYYQQIIISNKFKDLNDATFKRGVKRCGISNVVVDKTPCNGITCKTDKNVEYVSLIADNSSVIEIDDENYVPNGCDSSDYHIDLFVKASFHQGDVQFGEYGGMQCVCIAVYALCEFRHILPRVSKQHMDTILMDGHNLYVDILKRRDMHPRYLLLDDLFTEIPLNGNPLYHIEYQRHITEIGESASEWHSIQKCEASIEKLSDILITCFENSASHTIICIINEYASCMFKKHECYYFFDSHSRNNKGLPCADGTAILLGFDQLVNLVNYIRSLMNKLILENCPDTSAKFTSVTIADLTENPVAYNSSINYATNTVDYNDSDSYKNALIEDMNTMACEDDTNTIRINNSRLTTCNELKSVPDDSEPIVYKKVTLGRKHAYCRCKEGNQVG